MRVCVCRFVNQHHPMGVVYVRKKKKPILHMNATVFSWLPRLWQWAGKEDVGEKKEKQVEKEEKKTTSQTWRVNDVELIHKSWSFKIPKLMVAFPFPPHFSFLRPRLFNCNQMKRHWIVRFSTDCLQTLLSSPQRFFQQKFWNFFLFVGLSRFCYIATPSQSIHHEKFHSNFSPSVHTCTAGLGSGGNLFRVVMALICQCQRDQTPTTTSSSSITAAAAAAGCGYSTQVRLELEMETADDFLWKKMTTRRNLNNRLCRFFMG